MSKESHKRITIPKPYLSEVDRFANKFFVDEEGCWIWTDNTEPYGYGHFHYRKHNIVAHRFSYTLFKGKIPKGLDIDHLCRVRACVNPEHLEAVTARENILRGISHSAINVLKTHCAGGHELTEDNVRRPYPTNRQCKECHREANLKWWHGKTPQEKRLYAQKFKAQKSPKQAMDYEIMPEKSDWFTKKISKIGK